MVNLNLNQYAVDPFAPDDWAIVSSLGEEASDPQASLTTDFAGIHLMNRDNIKRKVLENGTAELGDRIEGITGRWTLFSQL